MKFIKFSLITVALFTAQTGFAEPVTLKTPQDNINYAVGVNMANTLKNQGFEVDFNLVMQGFKDASTDANLLLSEQELRKATIQYQNVVRKKQGARAKLNKAAANKKTGEAFLAQNKNREEVKTLPSGLQYLVLIAGKGKTPSSDDTVEYNYRGLHLKGTEYDSSYRSGKPVTVKVSESPIPALQEAFKLMPVGSKWQLFIPPQLAYGEQGLGLSVGPNETVILEVELLAIK
ncbi:FKBP-type peptidyl-prolyl cis-trans isomerase N-terminal domain-containing protein [Pelotalea chapellei]|uniref:Peptidyl-prolyl cis-trans isomerase n=1 Tax=Pelotalea chapellei TaxID=44671 RepID=A0ABS5U5M8_9BACT|nr:FKBP-type peptidyl-prolyl cis-trans isomerase [Pelotalea chapellei]MBT1070959.1 FKBP-type peptidyl-prolyl cis-trans isomerase [Pelotalea chapellei]